jgi:hypothetical protein
MEDDKVIEIIKMQQRPQVKILVKELFPTVQYGNREYSIEMLNFVDVIDPSKLAELMKYAIENIEKQKKEDLEKLEREFRSKQEEIAKSAPANPKKDFVGLVDFQKASKL